MNHSNPEKILCSIYRSPKKEGMYLYVPKKDGVENVPPELIQRMGTPGHVMDLLLTPDRKLARADVMEVMRGIADKGFFLQMPPQDGFNF